MSKIETPSGADKITIVGAGYRFARKAYQKVLGNHLLPTQLEETDSLKKARALLEEGTGLVLVYTHPSRMDPHRLMHLWKYPEFAERRTILPIALHQNSFAAVAISAPTGVEHTPVITQETIRRYKVKFQSADIPSDEKIFQALEGRTRAMSYLNTATEALGQGGLVCFAPTTTRTAELSMPPGNVRPTDTLLNAAFARRKRFGLLVTAFEINGLDSYKDARGLNLRKPYTLHIGNFFLDTELEKQLRDFRTQKGLPTPKRPFTNADEWLYQTQYPSLVPPAYLPR